MYNITPSQGLHAGLTRPLRSVSFCWKTHGKPGCHVHILKVVSLEPTQSCIPSVEVAGVEFVLLIGPS